MPGYRTYHQSTSHYHYAVHGPFNALCRDGPVGMVNFIDLIGHIRVSLFGRQGDDAGKPTRGLYFVDHNAKLPAYQFALYDEMVWS